MQIHISGNFSPIEQGISPSRPEADYEWDTLTYDQQRLLLTQFTQKEGVQIIFSPQDLSKLGEIDTITGNAGSSMKLSDHFDEKRYSTLNTAENSLGGQRVIVLEMVPKIFEERYQTVMLARVRPDVLTKAMEIFLKQPET